MESRAINIALLSSGRSDFNIYKPLIQELIKHKKFNLITVAFGSHLNPKQGNTVILFSENNLQLNLSLQTYIDGDSPQDTALEMAQTLKRFSEFYNNQNLDLIIGLGDRFEMFAALSASIPFGIPIAHFHGGETTLGAVDNKFRHAITLMSKYHFTSTEKHKQRVTELIGSSSHVYNVGSLGLDNVLSVKYLSPEEFITSFNVDLRKPTVLVTYHPETASLNQSKKHALKFISALKLINEQILITLPNSDTGSQFIRENLLKLAHEKSNVVCHEVLGLRGYYTALKHCKCVLGNSSSGIIEAASFGKYAINVGDRQKGRSTGKNVINCTHSTEEIISNYNSINTLPKLNGENIYGTGNTAGKVISILEQIHSEL